jgi:hypothetical protein
MASIKECSIVRRYLSGKDKSRFLRFAAMAGRRPFSLTFSTSVGGLELED